MPGFRFRISDLPEQPGERKIPLHRLFLPIGLILLAGGIIGLRNYFRLKGPPLAELHALKLTNVTNVVAEPEIPGSTRIDSIWLRTSDGAKIRYRQRFPYSDEIRRLNPNYGLFLDKTNVVWAVISGGGEILARNYFEEYNLEAKTVGKYCGSFLALFGVCLLFAFTVNERQFQPGKPMPKSLNPIRLRQLILFGSIVGYMALCFAVIFPLLSGRVAGWLSPLIWVFGAGLIGNGIVAYFRKHPPK
jgi:hypothetical protein